MKDRNVYRDCFFTKSVEADHKIKQLKQDYENVELQLYPISTKQEGVITITVVYYSSPKKSELFDDDEWVLTGAH